MQVRVANSGCAAWFEPQVCAAGLAAKHGPEMEDALAFGAQLAQDGGILVRVSHLMHSKPNF